MSMKLYVGNLAFQTTERDLEKLFSQVGTVESASIATDRDSGRSRGFGFVEMSLKAEGEAAVGYEGRGAVGKGREIYHQAGQTGGERGLQAADQFRSG